MPTPDLDRHPCFNEKARRETGRIHLPVAPACNVQCNFCDRRFDCVNETRPGVTSEVLSPQAALQCLHRAMEARPDIVVVGVAGPGDPFANAAATLETLRLVRRDYPELLLCVATNGLAIAPHLDELREIGVSHVTVTINAIDPAIGAKVYAWVRCGKSLTGGIEAARHLRDRQLEAVEGLVSRDIIVKVNSIIIPGVNDHHIPAIAEKVAALGAGILNCVPLYPVEGTPFESLGEPSTEVTRKVRKESARYLPQMHHCTRCRSDAVGRLGEDLTVHDFADGVAGEAPGPGGCGAAVSAACAGGARSAAPSRERPRIAVASWEGLLVNQHLGEADRLEIYEMNDGRVRWVESRDTPPRGGGAERWSVLGRQLADCRAVLVSGAGRAPTEVLEEAGVQVITTDGFIDVVLQKVFRGGAAPRSRAACGKGCGGSGSGMGCG